MSEDAEAEFEEDPESTGTGEPEGTSEEPDPVEADDPADDETGDDEMGDDETGDDEMRDDEMGDDTNEGHATVEEDTEGSPESLEDSDGSDAGIAAGDFVKIHFTLRRAEDGEVIDTTREGVAEDAGLEIENPNFDPRTVIVGEGHLFDAVEAAIIGGEPGDTETVTIPAADAFGEHDPDDIETVSAEKIPEDDRYPGAHVEIDGRQGHLETIIGGRARVDFNHPLAGEDIDFEYEIVALVEDRLERAEGIFDMYLETVPELWLESEEIEETIVAEPEDDGADGEDVPEGDDTEDVEQADADEEPAGEDDPDEPETLTEIREVESLYVESTPQLTMNQQWMFSKQQIAQEIIDAIDVERVVVQDVLEGMGDMGMPGMGGGGLEAALEDADVDAEAVVDELAGEEPDTSESDPDPVGDGE